MENENMTTTTIPDIGIIMTSYIKGTAKIEYCCGCQYMDDLIWDAICDDFSPRKGTHEYKILIKSGIKPPATLTEKYNRA
jgi:hypothetical protein